MHAHTHTHTHTHTHSEKSLINESEERMLQGLTVTVQT